jgi:Na+/H+-translocating membrane pyrophosphatase
MFSTVPSVIILAVSILVCAYLAGGYGIAIASAGILALMHVVQ